MSSQQKLYTGQEAQELADKGWAICHGPNGSWLATPPEEPAPTEKPKRRFRKAKTDDEE